MIDIVNENSAKENRTRSRLPVFTEAEKEYIAGSADFLGLNYYSSNYAEPSSDLGSAPNPSFFRDQSIQTTVNSSWPVAESSWLASVPEGLRALLKLVLFSFNSVLFSLTY